jgi:hypothetical protein
MHPDNPITPTGSYPTYAEVEALEQTWIASSALNVKNHNAYIAARKAYNAGPDTQQILDEAKAARDASLDAYSVTWATHDRAVKARAVAKKEHDVAHAAYNKLCDAFDAARKAHMASR